MRKPRTHREPGHISRRRGTALAAVAIAGAGLLGASFSTKPGSAPFYALSLGTAGTWLIGGLQSGSVHLGCEQAAPDRFREVAAPIATGVAAFGIFYSAARIARRIPMLNEAISSVLRYAQKGSDPVVMLTALANGLGEEVFFRGALFAALGDRHPILASTAIYSRNRYSQPGADAGLRHHGCAVRAPTSHDRQHPGARTDTSDLVDIDAALSPSVARQPARRPGPAHAPVNAMRS
jgi:hypothetical protein